MALEDITLALFAVCNSIRVFAYVPQIRKAALDRNGASAISYTTWALFSPATRCAASVFSPSPFATTAATCGVSSSRIRRIERHQQPQRTACLELPVSHPRRKSSLPVASKARRGFPFRAVEAVRRRGIAHRDANAHPANWAPFVVVGEGGRR
jgi:hypothetical protein